MCRYFGVYVRWWEIINNKNNYLIQSHIFFPSPNVFDILLFRFFFVYCEFPYFIFSKHLLLLFKWPTNKINLISMGSFNGCSNVWRISVPLKLFLIGFFFLISVRGAKPNKSVHLNENEVRGLCLKSREIFLSQPILLELEAPLKICGKISQSNFHNRLKSFLLFRWYSW